MNDVERRAYRFLMAADGIAVAVSMIAGPLGRTALAIGAGVSAILISLSLLIYTLWAWR